MRHEGHAAARIVRALADAAILCPSAPHVCVAPQSILPGTAAPCPAGGLSALFVRQCLLADAAPAAQGEKVAGQLLGDGHLGLQTQDLFHDVHSFPLFVGVPSEYSSVVLDTVFVSRVRASRTPADPDQSSAEMRCPGSPSQTTPSLPGIA